MNGSAVNASRSAALYFFKECDPYDDKLGGPSSGFLILLTTCSFEFLLGTPSNLWLICHIIRNMSKVSGILPADFFPFFMACTQLSLNLDLLVFLINHFLWQNAIVINVVIVHIALVLSLKPLLFCLVSVERYIAVVRPHVYLRYKARQYRWGCLCVSWCLTIPIACFCLTENYSITVSIIFLPVLAIDTFCSSSVLITLMKPPPGDRVMAGADKEGQESRKANANGSKGEAKVKEVDRSGLRGKAEMNTMKKKAFITLVIIQTVLVINYAPFFISLSLEGEVPERVLKCQYQVVVLAAGISCTYVQPLMYLHRLKTQNT